MVVEEKDLTPLSETEIVSRLESLPGWKYESNKIIKGFEFASFTEAVQFVNGLVGFCNFLDHHPDITISYKKVRFELTRFSVGGKVTARDFTVAQKIEDDFQKYIGRKVN
jgi:4a-hydroxytetrahydrobiopterin dehydratase